MKNRRMKQALFPICFLWLAAALLFVACEEDEPMTPPYRQEIADLPTDARGEAQQVCLDNGTNLQLETTLSGLRPDTLYRVRVLFTEREDGTQFLHREFTKNDFSAHVDAGYLDNSALVGIVYDKIDGDNLTFAVSVGSPDKSSDDYVPLLIKIGRTGSVSVSKDTRLDTSSADEAADEVF